MSNWTILVLPTAIAIPLCLVIGMLWLVGHERKKSNG